ncbi:hypothetical protein B0H19DRAFT_1253937 [Mycena capillaripes]|nr:hypothetical protein B0H19DRAFT_1253937 [Mycena capillaripes]
MNEKLNPWIPTAATLCDGAPSFSVTSARPLKEAVILNFTGSHNDATPDRESRHEVRLPKCHRQGYFQLAKVPCRQDAIIIGEVDDADELIQKGGRVGRNRSLFNDAGLIVCVTPATRVAAEKALKNRDLPLLQKSTSPDLSMAEMIVAACKV